MISHRVRGGPHSIDVLSKQAPSSAWSPPSSAYTVRQLSTSCPCGTSTVLPPNGSAGRAETQPVIPTTIAMAARVALVFILANLPDALASPHERRLLRQL